jgi:hypothetical protein
MAIDGHHSCRLPLSPSSPYKIDPGAPGAAPSTRPPPSSLPHTPPPGSSAASPCRPPGALAVGEHHLGPLALSLASRSARTRNPVSGFSFPHRNKQHAPPLKLGRRCRSPPPPLPHRPSSLQPAIVVVSKLFPRPL